MRLLSFILLLGFAFTSQAVVVSNLYEAQVPVTGQSSEERVEALQEALQQVLVKISGTTAVMMNDTIQTQSRTPDRFIRSYRYQSTPQGLALTVVFAPDLIDGLLHQAQQPIWGKSRPLILLWQGVETNGQRQILGQNSALTAQFEQAMNERGLPVLWPSLDLDDQMALPVGTLWGLFRDNISQASTRYLTDAQMAGKLFKNGGQWIYQGYLLHLNQRLELNASHEDVQVVLRQIADRIAQQLAEQYAVANTSTLNEQKLQVTGVKSYQQYQQLLTYLNSNTAIKQVQPLSMLPDVIIFNLELSADWAKVQSVWTLDKRLKVTDTENTYHWQF